MAIDIENLHEVLQTARKHGVLQLTVTGGGCTIGATFGQAPPPSAQPSIEAKPVAAVEPNANACPCGHDLDGEHADTYCLMGCPIEKCTPHYNGAER